jgi:hypothetical protein
MSSCWFVMELQLSWLSPLLVVMETDGNGTIENQIVVVCRLQRFQAGFSRRLAVTDNHPSSAIRRNAKKVLLTIIQKSQ